MPMVRTTLRSLEEMKAMFQKLSLPRFPLSPSQNTDTPPSLTKKLFNRGRSASYFPNNSPQTPIKTLQSPSTPSGTSSNTPITLVTPALSSGAWSKDVDDIRKPKITLLMSQTAMMKMRQKSCCTRRRSPDEAALVQAAKAYGCTLLGRSPEQVLVAVPGTGPLSIPLLHVLPFHSARKRMSVVGAPSAHWRGGRLHERS